jgi:site-specific recombinase XerD
MRQLEKRTDIRTHAHKFRATFATHLLQRGVDIRTVQELMGHTNIQTTMRYLAVADERLVAAVELL